MEEIPKITLVSQTVFVKWLTEGISEIYREYGRVFEFKLYFLKDLEYGDTPKEDLVEDIFDSEVMLLDIRGNSPTVEVIVNTYNKMEEGQPELYENKTIIALVGGNSEIRRLTKMGSFMAKKIPSSSGQDLDMKEIPDLTDGVRFGQRMQKVMKVLGRFLPFKTLRHARYWGLMMDYWVYGLAGVPENHKNMILFLLKKYLGYDDIDVEKPIKLPSYGIYDVQLEKYFDDLEEYLDVKQYDSSKQTVGIFFYGGLYFEQSLPIVEELVEKLSDFNIIPVFSDVLTNLEAHEEFFFRDGKKIVSTIINLQYFQLNGGPFGGDGTKTLNLFKTLDVPHFNPIIQYDHLIEEYEKSNEGIVPINQIIAVVMPELDGRIEMLTVGAMENLGYSEKIKSNVLEVVPLKENIDLVVKRFRRWLALRKKLNTEKKIALIVYNYPPGEDKIGNAAYLDVSNSLRHLLKRLDDEGYVSKNLPENKTIADFFIESGTVNSPKYTKVDNFRGVTLSKNEYLKFFKTLPSAMKEEIVEYWGEPIGNIMTMNSSIKLPIIEMGNIYLCLQPSRSTVSGDPNEYHDKNLPPHHQYVAFYKYIEHELEADAAIHIGTHGTEEFLPGKECAGWVHDPNINLMGALPNLYYYHVTNTSESAIAKRRGNAVIINHAGPTFQNSDLYQELELLESLINQYQNEKSEKSGTSERLKDLEAEIEQKAKEVELEFSSISELESLLYSYKTSVIPMGLHTLGEKFALEEIRDLLLMILTSSAEIPSDIQKAVNKFGKSPEEQENNLESLLTLTLESIFLDKQMDDEIKNPLQICEKYDLSDEQTASFINWIKELAFKIRGSKEMDNLIHALEGGYIEPGLGGDPIRSPAVFPTGKNSYGFDPRLIPNATAYRRGKTIAENLLENYKTAHGNYPKTVSVVLWAFETMKTGGETIGQIFNYLGVRAVKEKSIWTTELEVIPIEELKHPRINVITTICGIFRDTFPYLLELINEAVDLVATLDESPNQNFVKQSVEELKRKGMQQSHARVFGPPPGKYNTDLTEIVSAGQWGEEAELAADYLDNMSFAYMKNQKVKKNKKIFSENIGQINLMSQVRDSSEYHITDLDHYYEFTGGLAKSYEQISGKKANVFIADTSTKEIKISSLDKSIKEGAITRSLNPQWIKGLLKHEYHGGQKVAERVENILGLAATTNQVDNWIWDKTYDQYVENEEIKEALIENNRFAMMDIVKNMLQAENRGYWKADEEQLQELKKLYLELENWVEKTY
ncbi:MAG: magnesium chelatase subunit H [Promethearchaeia archaeon]